MSFLKRYFARRKGFLTLVDAFIILLTLFLSISLRFGLDMEKVLLVPLRVQTFDPLLLKSVTFVLIYLLSFHYFELYNPASTRFGREMFIKLSQSLFTATVLLFILYYILPSLQLGRGILMAEFVLMPLFLLLWRFLYTHLVAKSLPNERILILGTGSLAQKIGSEIAGHTDLGLEVVGFLTQKDEKDKIVEKHIGIGFEMAGFPGLQANETNDLKRSKANCA